MTILMTKLRGLFILLLIMATVAIQAPPAVAQADAPFPVVAEFEVDDPPPGEAYLISAVSVSADGETLLYARWRTEDTVSDLVVLDIASGESVVFENASSRFTSVTTHSISSDGTKVVFGSSDGTYVWDLDDASVTQVSDQRGTAASMSSDGAYLAVQDSQVLIAIDVATDTEVIAFEGRGYISGTKDLVLLPTENIPEFRIVDLDVRSGKSDAELITKFNTIEACEEGLALCNTALAEWMNFPEGTAIDRKFAALGLQASGNNNLFAGDNDNTITLYDISGGFEIRYAATFDQLTGAMDYTPADADVLRLYQAYFARTPDLGGAKYWIESVLRQGYSVEQIALWMSETQEFTNNYAGKSNGEYMSAVYGNVLGRTPDSEGYAYWLDLLDSGQLDRSGVVFWIAQNEEFRRQFQFD